MKKKHISRKMYFKEITPIQSSSSSAHGCAQALLLPRKQDLLGEHLLAPIVGPYTCVCISAASAERKMQGMRHFKKIFLSTVLSFGNLLCAPNPIVSETRRTKAATHQDSKLQGLSCREKAIPKSYLVLRRLQFTQKLSEALFYHFN